MRASDISPSQRRLLQDLASGISDRLRAEFVDLAGIDEDHVGIALHEGDRRVVIELPFATLQRATTDPSGREVLRTRMKGRRDRMMFRTPPRPLPKNVAPLFSPGPPRAGYRGGRR